VADFPPALSQSCRPSAGACPPSLCHDDPLRRDADTAGQAAWGAASGLPAAAQIQQALVQTGGNVARAARLLGVSRDTVRYRMQQYGLVRPRLETLRPAGSPWEPGRVNALGPV